MKLVGIFAAIALSFGLLGAVLLASDPYAIVPIHLVVGTVLLAVFFIGGGAKSVLGAKDRIRHGAGMTLYSSLFLSVVVVLNVIAYRTPLFSIDTTAEDVFTLAPESEEVFSALKQPLAIRAFYLGGRITDSKLEELLRRLERSYANVSVEVIDPEKRPTLVQRFQITEQGMIHLSLGGEAATPHPREVRISGKIDEEMVTNAVKKLVRKKERTVYYITGHGEPDLESASYRGYSAFKEALAGEGIRVLPLMVNSAIPSGSAALILAAPQRPYLPEERQIVARYLEQGGSALVLNDIGDSQELQALVKPLGITLEKDVILDQKSLQVASGEIGLEPMITQFGKHPITESFQQAVVLTTATSVKGGVPLALTSESSWAERNLGLIFGNEPRARFEEGDEKGPVAVAAAVEGKGRVVVVGDSEFVNNQNIRQLFNRDFVLNTLNWVVGEEQGVTLRARTYRASVAHLSPEHFTVFFLFTTIVLPELLLVSGVTVWWRRRKS
jgi:ABC-type uncharacterized transport system involved in gliding motility auxiliary subunit